MPRTLLAVAAAAAVTLPALAQERPAKAPPSEPIGWITDYAAAVKLAKRTGRPMLIDFWCGT